jgi:hypothetical protein
MLQIVVVFLFLDHITGSKLVPGADHITYSWKTSEIK